MKQLIYIELDCLLDTRIVTLASMVTPELAAGLVSDKYRERDIDDFTDLCGVSKAAFMEKYRKRDKETLKYARPTNMVTELNDLIMTSEKGAIYTPYTEGIDLQVNTYPYDLTDVEMETIGDAVMSFSGVDCRVEVVKFSPEALTPGVIKSSYAAVFMYDLNQWLEIHGTDLSNNRMPTVTFVAPALYLDRVPEDGEVLMPDKDVKDPFAAAELALMDAIDLRLQSPSLFSLLEV